MVRSMVPYHIEFAF